MLLSADRLAMRYGRRVLFRDLSFEVESGAPLAITGANGAGKSTLLKILAGVVEPAAGRVRLERDGRAVPDLDRPLAVGFVAPYLQLYDPFSAWENLAFLAKARRLPDGETRMKEVLDRVGLAARAHDPLATFSTGMRQRLRIAAALLHDPPVLLLDEPSATLDEAGRALVDSVIATQKIVVVATNEPEEAAKCARRLALDAA